ncbi:hypothetical protein ABVT39_013794 [Epinephelus coioides]
MDSYQDERRCLLRLKPSPVQHLFLGNIVSFAVPLVEEPGVDHGKNDGVQEDVNVPVVRFHRELVFCSKRVQQIHTTHVFIVGTHNMILKQLVDTAIDMHSKGVFHGDIKLQNVLVQGSCSEPRVWITDFGCATSSTEEAYASFSGIWGFCS